MQCACCKHRGDRSQCPHDHAALGVSGAVCSPVLCAGMMVKRVRVVILAHHALQHMPAPRIALSCCDQPLLWQVAPLPPLICVQLKRFVPEVRPPQHSGVATRVETRVLSAVGSAVCCRDPELLCGWQQMDNFVKVAKCHQAVDLPRLPR